MVRVEQGDGDGPDPEGVVGHGVIMLEVLPVVSVETLDIPIVFAGDHAVEGPEMPEEAEEDPAPGSGRRSSWRRPTGPAPRAATDGPRSCTSPSR